MMTTGVTFKASGGNINWDDIKYIVADRFLRRQGDLWVDDSGKLFIIEAREGEIIIQEVGDALGKI